MAEYEISNVVSLEAWKASRTSIQEVAAHEIGHEVAINDVNGVVHEVSVKPMGNSLGRTWYTIWEANPQTQVVKEVAAAQGSYESEELVGITNHAGTGGDQHKIESLRAYAARRWNRSTADNLIRAGRSIGSNAVRRRGQMYIINRALAVSGEPLISYIYKPEEDLQTEQEEQAEENNFVRIEDIRNEIQGESTPQLPKVA